MRRIGDVMNLIEDLSAKDYNEYAKENNISRELAEIEVDGKIDALTELLNFYNDFKNVVDDKELTTKFKCQYDVLKWFLQLESINIDTSPVIDDNIFHKHGEFF